MGSRLPPPAKPVALIVEDDADQRALAATLVEESGFRVIECDSAEAALEAAAERQGDLAFVFADVRLAGRADGVELARTLDAQYPAVRVLVTSGASGHRLRELPRRSEYMPKPWRPLDLLIRAEQARLRA